MPALLHDTSRAIISLIAPKFVEASSVRMILNKLLTVFGRNFGKILSR